MQRSYIEFQKFAEQAQLTSPQSRSISLAFTYNPVLTSGDSELID